MKKCICCNIFKPIDQFYKHKEMIDGHLNKCKRCVCDYAKQRAKEKRSEISEYQKQYRINNRKKLSKYQQSYRKENKEYVSELNRKYISNRRKTDLNFRLRDALRSRLGRVIRRNQRNKGTLELLGCSIEEFKNHLEQQFEPGMTWDNWGRSGWHIDHIKPLSSFDLTDPQQLAKATHYTNLQPLWAEDNIKKGKNF